MAAAQKIDNKVRLCIELNGVRGRVCVVGVGTRGR